MQQTNIIVASRDRFGAGSTPYFNLPAQPTTLVAREKEVQTACRLLRKPDVRLLTLVGPGGVGKTRLGVEIAGQLYQEFTGGVCYVELAPVTDPNLVVPTISQTLGLSEDSDHNLQAKLLEYLQERAMLLMLDNFEHLLSAATQIAALLAQSPRVKVLVTSREPLRLRGEQELQVEPLALPEIGSTDSGRLDIASLAANPAVSLFLQRAAAVKPDFVLTNANARAVAEICVRLDGLPLAIELATARLKVLQPAALLSRLQGALQLLTGGANDLPSRQQTLRDTIEWSYNLLDREEQQVFRRMAVFAGGCTLEAAEHIAGYVTPGDRGTRGAAQDVLELLLSLADKSLLRRVDLPEEESRIAMLETIHQYALEKLEGSEEARAVREHHAQFFLRLVDEAEPRLKGPEQIEWLNKLDHERDNLRAALGWAAAEPNTTTTLDVPRSRVGLRIAGGLLRLWQVRGPIHEGRDWVGRMLKLDKEAGSAGDSGDREWMAARARALATGGRLAYLTGPPDESVEYLTECGALYHTLGDKNGEAAALMGIANVSMEASDYDKAVPIYEECLAIWRELGSRPGIAGALNNLGLVAMQKGDYTRAAELMQEGLAIIRQLGDKERIATMTDNLGRILLRQGQYERAALVIRDSLSLVIEMKDNWGTAYSLEGLAEVAIAGGKAERAARLLGAAEAAYKDIYARLDREDRGTYDKCVADIRRRISGDTFNALFAEGNAMSPEQAIAAGGSMQPVVAEQQSAPTEAPPAAGKPARQGNLSSREVEVLRLVAAGLSDAEVAGQLFLSKHTVNAHLRNIYSKIGVTSRSAATRYALENSMV